MVCVAERQWVVKSAQPEHAWLPLLGWPLIPIPQCAPGELPFARSLGQGLSHHLRRVVRIAAQQLVVSLPAAFPYPCPGATYSPPPLHGWTCPASPSSRILDRRRSPPPPWVGRKGLVSGVVFHTHTGCPSPLPTETFAPSPQCGGRQSVFASRCRATAVVVVLTNPIALASVVIFSRTWFISPPPLSCQKEGGGSCEGPRPTEVVIPTLSGGPCRGGGADYAIHTTSHNIAYSRRIK